MSHVYLAVIDQFGLRALEPENRYGACVALALSRRLQAAVRWVLIAEDVRHVLKELLEAGEFGTACDVLVATAVQCGPAYSDRNRLAG
jgi:hypothetical protein